MGGLGCSTETLDERIQEELYNPLSKRTDGSVGLESSGTEACPLDGWGETSQDIVTRRHPAPTIAVGIGRGSSLSCILGYRSIIHNLSYASVLGRVIRINKLSHSDCKSTVL